MIRGHKLIQNYALAIYQMKNMERVGLHSLTHILKVCKKGVLSRVSGPYSFYPDPDPAFEAGDQSGSGSRALMTKNGEKITAGKKIQFFFDQKLQFTYP